MAARKRRKRKQPRVSDAEYHRCAVAWERNPDRGAGNWMLEPADLPVGPIPFMQTLRALGMVAQDRAIRAAADAILKLHLVDAKGRWNRYANLANPLTLDLCEDIEIMIA